MSRLWLVMGMLLLLVMPLSAQDKSSQPQPKIPGDVVRAGKEVNKFGKPKPLPQIPDSEKKDFSQLLKLALPYLKALAFCYGMWIMCEFIWASRKGGIDPAELATTFINGILLISSPWVLGALWTMLMPSK